MVDLLLGKKSYAYWGRHTVFGSGDGASHRHQAFNPIIEALNFPKIVPGFGQAATGDSQENNIEWDENQEPGVITLRCLLKDTILMAAFFEHKELPTSWSGTADVMTFNFTDDDDKDEEIWAQFHIHDNSNNGDDLDLLFNGGRIISYRLEANQGGRVFEVVQIKFAKCTENIELVDIDDGFDDGSFDQTGVAEVYTITALAANSITTDTYFLVQSISSALVRTKWHVWFNKDAGGADPDPDGSTAIVVAITTDDTAATVATAIGAALDAASGDFGTPVVATALVTVTSANQGHITDPVDVDSGLTVATTTQGKTARDGGWANWDGAYAARQCAHMKDCIITVASASISGLQLKNFTFEMRYPIEFDFTQDSLVSQYPVEGVRSYTATFTGNLKDNTDFAEFLKAISSKTNKTVKIQYGTTKYIQCTNMKHTDIAPPGAFPPAGKATSVTYTYISMSLPVVTFSWTASEADDPSNMIKHSDI